MLLWTIQPPEIINIIEQKGEFICDSKLSECYSYFHDAYDWMVTQMDNHDIIHPKNLKLPLWAWHTFNWKHKKPDFRCCGLGIPKSKYVCIEFEIPNNQVLLSDFDNWHFVLNKSWIDNSTNSKTFKESCNWFDKLDKEKQNEVISKSWLKIFNVNQIHTDWYDNGKYIQATFWKLKKEMIGEVRYFTAR